MLISALEVNASQRPSNAELATITQRGRLLAAYDAAARQATDALLATYLKAEPGGSYIAHETDAGWVVDFGKLSGPGDKFFVYSEVVPVGGHRYKARSLDSPREDTGWNLSAARGIEAATRDFHGADCPYNVAVLPATGGKMYVYLYPAQVKRGVYLLGADVRYLISADGTQILEKRQMHKTIIEYASVGAAGEKEAGGYHTHVLSDVPEDTDVLMVLTRKPRVPEFIGAGRYIYTIAIDGTITAATRPHGRRLPGP